MELNLSHTVVYCRIEASPTADCYTDLGPETDVSDMRVATMENSRTYTGYHGHKRQKVLCMLLGFKLWHNKAKP
jgi:iron uptake system EfeUOB component EfeO/EfeM